MAPLIRRTYLDNFGSHRLGSSSEFFKTLWTDIFGSHRGRSSQLVRRDPGLERLTILAMSVFFVLVGALTIVGAVFVGREISARSRDRKERKRQFEVDGVAM